MKRRVHPKVQMLHGARLAVQHIKDLHSAANPEDLAEVFWLIRTEVGDLTDYALRAYCAMAHSAFKAAVRRG